MRTRALPLLALLILATLASTCGRRMPVSPLAPSPVRTAAPPTVAAAPPAPALVTPADSAQVLEPVPIAWSAVTDPTGILAYNWQVSASPTFAVLAQIGSTNGALADTVSGLPNGTWFWRAQAVNNAFVQGAWSTPRGFTVTGVAPTVLAPPVLGPPQAYTTFHPREVIQFHWSPVAGAVTYRLEISTDLAFPMGSPLPAGTLTFWFDNIPNPGFSFMLGDNEGTFHARVFAVDADNPQFGVRSQPSNTVDYTVFYTNPIGPAPVPIGPTGGATIALPFNLTWHHVPNPQPAGYEVQVSPSSAFSTIEASNPQITDSLIQVLSLTAGTKFWRVRSAQGMASPLLVAETAWSPTQSFVVSTAPAAPVSVTALKNPLFSGENTFVQVQLSAGVPAAGATVALSSSNPAAAPVPATLAVPGNAGLVQFQMTAGQVTAPTPVTITATLNGVSTTGTVNVLPPSLNSVFVPFTQSSGSLSGGNVLLNGAAPAGGALVSLTSSSPAASPPATLLIPAGDFSAPFTMPTTGVAVSTPVTITATWHGASVQNTITLTPQQPPATFTLNPTAVVGQSGSSFGRVTVATAPATDLTLSIASSQPSIAQVNNSMIIPAGSIQGGFNVFTQPVATPTVVTISVSGGGVTLTAPLTVNPVGTAPPPPPLSGLTLNPSSVDAGGSAVGTVTLTSPAPVGGQVVTLSSGLPLRIAVPASVTVPAGGSSATFTVTTTLGPSTSTNISATVGGFSLTAGFLVNSTPPPTPGTPTLVSPADGSSPAQPVTLDWNDVANAASYEVQVANNSSLTPPLTANPTVTVSQATLSGLPTQRLWWRVRAANSAGVFWPFSASRRFTPQASTTPPPPPPPASLSALGVSPTSVTGGTNAAGTVSLTSAAPTGGLLVALSSGNAAAGVPASVTVPAGATSAGFTVTTTSVAASTPVTLTASLAGISRTTTLTVAPPGAVTLSAPSQLSPPADGRFAPGTAILFDWSDIAGAAGYTIQIDDNSAFPAPLVFTQDTPVSQVSSSTLPTTTMWWRVRANSSTGAAGTWSAARRFEVKL